MHISKICKQMLAFCLLLILLFSLFLLQVSAANDSTETVSRQVYNGKKLGVPVGTLMEDAAKAYSPDSESGGYTDMDVLSGKRIGVLTGAIHDSLVAKRLPTAEIVYFNEVADMPAAMKSGKIDAFILPGSSAVFMRYEDESLTWLDEHLVDADLGYAFAKTDEGRALNAQFSDYIRRLRADGGLDALRKKWFNADESEKTLVDYASLPDTNGTLRMATAARQVPFTYVRDQRIVGFEVDIAAGFCAENGYRLQVEQMNFDGILAAVQSGKCDFAGSCLAITPERQESVDFSESYFAESVVAVVPDSTTKTSGSFILWQRGKQL